MPLVPVSGTGDMFLKVKGAKHGEIKGESNDPKHKEEIQVLSWSWGMQAHRSLGSGQATGRASMADLKITKRVDKASTALMGALRTNESVEATLTVRKAGGEQLEYLKVKIEEGRLTSLVVDGGDETGGGTDLVEHVSFSYNKIQVDYVPQGADGGKQGGTTFADSWSGV